MFRKRKNKTQTKKPQKMRLFHFFNLKEIYYFLAGFASLHPATVGSILKSGVKQE